MSQMAVIRMPGMRSMDSMRTRPWAPQPMTATRSSSALPAAAGGGAGAGTGVCGGSCAKAVPARAAPSPAVAEDLRNSRRLILPAAGVLSTLAMIHSCLGLKVPYHTIKGEVGRRAILAISVLPGGGVSWKREGSETMEKTTGRPVLALALILLAAACGSSSDNGGTNPPPTPKVTVSPGTATVATGATRSFTATVSGSTDQNVTWKVNGVRGGSATYGLISLQGVYIAPVTVPSSATVTITATAF